jgi:uncharacterized membrane protein YfcA
VIFFGFIFTYYMILGGDFPIMVAFVISLSRLKNKNMVATSDMSRITKNVVFLNMRS